jgi:transposase
MTKAEQTRLSTWRLKVIQRAGERARNVARTCRHFGISRQAFYKWKKRYDAHGTAGLCDRPRRPQRSPRATPAAVVSKILYLRQTYHFGLGKIADYLKRFHEMSVARSSVHRILGRHGMHRLPANQKHQPHRKRWSGTRSRSPATDCNWT